MTNPKKFIYDVEKVEQYGYSDFQFISSWSMNNKSWRVQKEIPIKIIRYEDLLKETYYVFKDVIEFINKTLHIKDTSKISKEKIPFFNLGPDNDWKKILDKDQQIKLTEMFQGDLIELGYK
jgi:hypothetical protein